MTEETIIHDLRLSFIWVETFLNLVKNEPLEGTKLTFLKDKNDYVSTFDALQQEKLNGINSKELHQPWPGDSKTNNFWTYYLETIIPGQIKKDTVWQKLIPFYHRVTDLTIENPVWLNGRMALQSFIYPYGVALIISAEINLHAPQVLNMTLDKTIETANKVRHDHFQIKLTESSNPHLVSLDELASQELKRLREYMLGPNAPVHEWGIRSPFSVATIVRGSNVERDTLPGQEAICFLDALARWPTYDWNDPPPGSIPQINEEDKIKVKQGYYGDTFQIVPRGRTVWYPKFFLPTAKRADKLSCYHKNLGMLSMQIESMGDLVEKASKEINAGNLPSPASFYEACVKRAAINLSFLYLGGGNTKKTYRSWSAKRQIEQNNYLEAINIVRDKMCNLLRINSY
jgi:hypothetical protein